ncbi:uncharacterized protein LAJ45_06124 [Morchella importuna]|uniref:Cwf21-domain-containing protein n=1 Tax=Morchella conica CCBAS932 TaxID=1392247 RepID=A0A3N4KZR7_9PEZI|nr:uncharacterized protein LAJ45_06124 [Morchella importuna]KAH8149971.1 hypothetical protein LAJ45_06124 [Morchella importuna]RPB16036.1 cwf21-domain-containing protein [Morchella conica CCBAS932]
MSSNVGLTTPRGSGTSGYVQRNLSHLKPRDNIAPYPKDYDSFKTYKQRQPDKEILEHDRKREVEVKCLELRDKLEDEEVDEEEIERQVDELRVKLLDEMKRGAGGVNARGLKPHQVHELAAAKLAESERLRNALKISADYEEGSHWRKQSEKKERKREMRESEYASRKERDESP